MSSSWILFYAIKMLQLSLKHAASYLGLRYVTYNIMNTYFFVLLSIYCKWKHYLLHEQTQCFLLGKHIYYILTDDFMEISVKI